MREKTKPPSLLPYLQSGPGRLHLVISPEPVDRSPFEPCQDPFQFKDASNPFSLLGNAGVVSDLAEQILPLHILMQRSDYLSSPEDPNICTNLSIEQRWQQILSILSTPPLNTLRFLLAEQMGKQGQLLPFHSLFYCRAKQIFFPPPCPSCGQELVLCTDDTLLFQHGLEGYSTSLRRFLYCPECSPPPVKGTFYAFSRTQKDPGCVRDTQQLIRNWSLSEKPAAPDALLPCGCCPSYKVCHGSNTLAVNTLCSFSFYPFHMLLLRDDSGVPLDFQALLSGTVQPEDCLRCEETPTGTASILQSSTLKTSGPMPETDTPDASASANAAIHAILADISTQWEISEQEKQHPPPNNKTNQPPSMPSSQRRENVDLMETVILSSTPVSQNIPDSMDREKRGSIYKEADVDLDATLSISPQFDPAATIQLRHTTSEIQSPRKEPFDPTIKSHLEENLQETIIISPQAGQQQNHLKRSPAPPENTGSETNHGGPPPLSGGKTDEEDLAETIIQRPIKKT